MRTRVLIIDDDARLCDEMSEVLEDEGFGVSISHDGSEGKALVEHNRYDVILLDLELPGASGFEIIRALQHKDIGLDSVIVITGHQGAIDAAMSDEPSGDEDLDALKDTRGVVSKPFDMTALLAMIKNVFSAGKNGGGRGLL